MELRDTASLLEELPFFHDVRAADLALIAGCGVNAVYHPGEFLVHEGSEADAFFVVRHGTVAVETSIPGHGAVVLQTVGSGDVTGFSWLFPPYRAALDVRAVDTVRAIKFDGTCLRRKCETDPRLGYLLMKKFAGLMADRLQATLLQLVDIYDVPRSRVRR